MGRHLLFVQPLPPARRIMQDDSEEHDKARDHCAPRGLPHRLFASAVQMLAMTLVPTGKTKSRYPLLHGWMCCVEEVLPVGGTCPHLPSSCAVPNGGLTSGGNRLPP